MASYAELNSYNRINTSTTTVVKAGSGYLNTINLSAAAATATINVFDNTAGSGTVIFSYTQGAAALTAPVTLELNVRFSTGLTIVTAVAAVDMTVSFK